MFSKRVQGTRSLASPLNVRKDSLCVPSLPPEMLSQLTLSTLSARLFCGEAATSASTWIWTNVPRIVRGSCRQPPPRSARSRRAVEVGRARRVPTPASMVFIFISKVSSLDQGLIVIVIAPLAALRAKQLAPVDPDGVIRSGGLDGGELSSVDPVADRPLAHSERLSGLGNLQEIGSSLCHALHDRAVRGGAALATHGKTMGKTIPRASGL